MRLWIEAFLLFLMYALRIIPLNLRSSFPGLCSACRFHSCVRWQLTSRHQIGRWRFLARLSCSYEEPIMITLIPWFRSGAYFLIQFPARGVFPGLFGDSGEVRLRQCNWLIRAYQCIKGSLDNNYTFSVRLVSFYIDHMGPWYTNGSGCQLDVEDILCI